MSQELHQRIMNIRPVVDNDIHDKEMQAYRRGHRDARHAAAEIVITPPASAGGAQETLEQYVSSALNRFSAENASNTPDFILAQFLLGCLDAWNRGVQQRETWYGRDARPGSICASTATPPVPAERTETERLHDKEARAWRRGYEDGLAVGELVAAPLKAEAATLRAHVETLKAALKTIAFQGYEVPRQIAEQALGFIPTEDA